MVGLGNTIGDVVFARIVFMNHYLEGNEFYIKKIHKGIQYE